PLRRTRPRARRLVAARPSTGGGGGGPADPAGHAAPLRLGRPPRRPAHGDRPRAALHAEVPAAGTDPAGRPPVARARAVANPPPVPIRTPKDARRRQARRVRAAAQPLASAGPPT